MSIEERELYETLLMYIERRKINDGVQYTDSLIEIEKVMQTFKDKVEDVLTSVCCICGKRFDGLGNNPYPISDEGRCCDKCNDKVIEARIAALRGE